MKLFGTDGVRGVFGEAPLDKTTIERLGYELGLESRRALGRDPVFVIGGDTRESRRELCSYIASGLRAAGAKLRNAGMLPTPGVAWLVQSLEADGGIVLSASHNPWRDNGVKLIDSSGFKWSTDAESKLEKLILSSEFSPPQEEGSGVDEETDLVGGYLDHLASTLSSPDSASNKVPLRGLHIAIDTGNGAASPYAGALFERLGAKVEMLFDQPNGRNINLGCGSTAPEIVARRVVEIGAHMGVAFDGDADRVILCDDLGRVCDGDEILYLWAKDLAKRGALGENAIVATTMSNLGLSHALAKHNISLLYCDVGDRAVVERLREEQLLLGGEQSGHIINLSLATTGDGMLTALHLAALVAKQQAEAEPATLSESLADFGRLPQVLINVQVHKKPPLKELKNVKLAIDRAEQELGESGRLVLRYSGTEPKARVMIEGTDQAEIERLANDIADAIRSAIGD